jgi:hypothetical protein
LKNQTILTFLIRYYFLLLEGGVNNEFIVILFNRLCFYFYYFNIKFINKKNNKKIFFPNGYNFFNFVLYSGYKHICISGMFDF